MTAESGMGYVSLLTGDIDRGAVKMPTVDVQWSVLIRSGETISDAVVRSARSLIKTLEVLPPIE